MVNKTTIDIIKSTAPILKEHGETITKVFYTNLFNNHPQLKDTFNMVHQKKGTQQKALANAVFQYAIHIDKLEMLGSTVDDIVQKHVSLSIPKEAYPIVGSYLLEAIKEVLGKSATPQIINAWAEAYNNLACIFIEKETGIYKKQKNNPFGYNGMKEFEVFDKIVESDVITSFYIRRKDSKELPSFIPGQYVAVQTEIPNTAHKHTRNYSLSDSPTKDYFRISIKKEIGNPNGVVSNFLHDDIEKGSTLSIGMPAGNFVIKKSTAPIVLISGGIGITPLLSMFKFEAKKGKRQIVFIQCALNSKTHAFKNEIKNSGTEKTTSVIVYSEPTKKDKKLNNFDYEGFLSPKIIDELDILNNSEFYFCGPPKFMANTLQILKLRNVPENQINYEFFGPKEEL